jgi:hypothetical protein
MRNTNARLRLALVSGLSALALAGSVVQARVADAATYSGPWSAVVVAEKAVDTPMYKTNSAHKVSTCVKVTNLHSSAAAKWSYELIWYDGGKNKVLYHSPDHLGLGRDCSPVRKLGGNNKVYDKIILFNSSIGELVNSGTYFFNTY